MKVVILGINGFIGNALAERILTATEWSVYGMDIQDDKLGECHGKERFHFVEGDICINREWIEYRIPREEVRRRSPVRHVLRPGVPGYRAKGSFYQKSPGNHRLDAPYGP